MITLGTGVGGGIVIDGKIVSGRFGAAGEIGHIQVEKEEKRFCGCGKHGHLEQYASATGIVWKTTELLKMLWSSIFVTLMANKIGGLQFGIYRNCQISSRVFHTAVAALPLTKANRSDFE